MPTGLSGLFHNTYGAKKARKRGEFSDLNIGNKTFSEIRKESYDLGYSDGYEDGYRDGKTDKDIIKALVEEDNENG